MINGKLADKEKTDSIDELKPQEVAEQDHVELFGREFRIVQNGLDPEEVADYIRNASSSTDAIFKQLEQFSAIQAVAKTMDESVTQVKRLAENARAQAEAEIRQEKAQIMEDAKLHAAEVVERVTNICRTSLDTIHSAVLEDIRDAFERTRETAARIITEMEENAQAEVVARLGQSSTDIKQPEEGVSVPEASDSEDITAVEKEETQVQMDSSPDLTGLYESWEKLRESEKLLEATIRDNSVSTEGEEPADIRAVSQSETENDLQVEAGNSPQGEAEQELANQGDDTKADEEQELSAITAGPESDKEKHTHARAADGEPDEKGSALYSGDVTLVLPEGVPTSWSLHLRQRILETPGVQILWESYSCEDGNNLKLSLSEPLALPDMLREMPDVVRVTDQSSNGANKRKGLNWLSGKQQQQQTLVIELGI